MRTIDANKYHIHDDDDDTLFGRCFVSSFMFPNQPATIDRLSIRLWKVGCRGDMTQTNDDENNTGTFVKWNSRITRKKGFLLNAIFVLFHLFIVCYLFLAVILIYCYCYDFVQWYCMTICNIIGTFFIVMRINVVMAGKESCTTNITWKPKKNNITSHHSIKTTDSFFFSPGIVLVMSH